MKEFQRMMDCIKKMQSRPDWHHYIICRHHLRKALWQFVAEKTMDKYLIQLRQIGVLYATHEPGCYVFDIDAFNAKVLTSSKDLLCAAWVQKNTTTQEPARRKKQLVGKIIAFPIYDFDECDPWTGHIIYRKDTILTDTILDDLENRGFKVQPIFIRQTT
jgi:hypothetical protein